MKKMETDIIVAAAGLSGLAAAISAAENGARVLVFEKSGTTGGAANMGMGPLGVGSRIQREHMISLTPGEAFRKHMYFTHYRVDARMVRDYYYKSGDTIGPEVMGTLGQHFGRLTLKAFNREDMKTAVQMIQSKLLVRNTLGQDMYSMKFDMGRCGW